MEYKDIDMDISTISKLRGGLMGIATIMVLFYHFAFVGRTPFILPFNALSQIGFGGVDVFMMLSGVGLTFSMSKNPGVVSFYKKRLTRLFPSFLVLTIAYSVLNTNDSWQTILWKCTTFGYWTNLIIHEWYTPAIIALYALFPLVFKYLIKDRNDIRLIIAIGVALIIMFEELFFIHFHWYHICLINRLPIFLFGCFLAKRLIENRLWNGYFKISVALLSFAAIIFLLPKHTYSFWCVVALIVPFLIIPMCKVLEIRWLSIIMGGVGNASYEIYMLHIIILDSPVRLQILQEHPEWHNCSTFILSAISIVAGWLIHIFFTTVITKNTMTDFAKGS